MPRAGVRVEVRSGAAGHGPNLAAGLVNVSEEGAAVVVSAQVRFGEQVEVVFVQASGVQLRVMADIRWCNAVGRGQFEAGAQFRRRLTPEELLDVCY